MSRVTEAGKEEHPHRVPDGARAHAEAPARAQVRHVSPTGKVTEVKELLSSVPLSDVDSIEAKHFGLGAILTLTAGAGAAIKLECRVGGARALVEAFNRAKAAA